MELDPRQNKITAAIDATSDTIRNVSHQIHSHPELGYQEEFASKLLTETLESYGFQVERGYAGIPTAFCARKGREAPSKGPDRGRRIAFLAEYDALPDIGHACGHNLIATSALSAGIGLGAVVDDLDGQVWVIGTPAEETDGAKVHMVDRGVFDDVDVALMTHPHMGSYYLTHSLAMDAIQVEFFGRASHAAAAPWDGQNALDAVLLTFNNINALRQQMRLDARIHGVITQGGLAPNIIPDHTAARFYVRAAQRSYLDELVNKFKACAQAAALATGTRVEFANYESSFDNMVNNLTLAQRMRLYLEEALGSGPVQSSPGPFGSVDMGNVSHVVPAVHILFDIANGQALSPHTHDFCQAAASTYAGEAMIRAGKALALTGYDVLHDSSFYQTAKDEFEQALGKVPARRVP